MNLDRASLYRQWVLPFDHAITRITWDESDSPSQVARATLGSYRDMLKAVGADVRGDGDSGSPTPYNLLVTRHWMFLVPRSRECFASISLNALAFAGTLLVHDELQLEKLKENGAMTALRHVAYALC